MVADLGQVELDLGLETGLTSRRPTFLIFEEHICHREPVMLSFKVDALFNSELNLVAVDAAVRVVNVDHRFCLFLGRVDVFLEVTPHLAVTLVDTAPSLNVSILFHLLVHLELHWLFPDSQYLLVLHLVVRVGSVHFGLDIVLDLCLGLFTSFLILEVNT